MMLQVTEIGVGPSGSNLIIESYQCRVEMSVSSSAVLNPSMVLDS